MEEVWSAEFTVKAVFYLEVYWDEFTFFSLRTIKGRNLVFQQRKVMLE